MSDIYLLSGLGADERAFQFLDLKGFNTHFIRWYLPTSETLEEYASILSKQITTPHPIIVGLSFGGIVGIEIAKIMDIEQVILISSVKTRQEMPTYFRVAGKLRLNKIFPTSVLKIPNGLVNWLFGIKKESDKKIFAEMLVDTNLVFIKWAIDKILTWKQTSIIKNVIHIHGIEDKLLPISAIQVDYKIIGGHFMIVNKAEELSKTLRDLLNGIIRRKK